MSEIEEEVEMNVLRISNLGPTVTNYDVIQFFDLDTTPFLQRTCSLERAYCEKTGQATDFAFLHVPKHVSVELIKLSGIEFYGRVLVIEDVTEDSNLEKVICTICKKIYDDPRMLHCLDTFCKECIQKLLCDDPNGIVVCPICKYRTETGTNQDLLWRNQVVQNKVNKVMLKKGGKILSCNECEGDAASQFCFDCKLRLCGSCSNHHMKCARNVAHKMESIENIPERYLLEPEKLTCPKHKKHLNYYCEHCKISICIDCNHSRVHQNHSVILVSELVEEEVNVLKQLIPDVRLKCKEYEEVYLKDVEDFVETAEIITEGSKKVVEKAYDMLISTLEAGKAKQLALLDETYISSKLSLKGATDELKILEATTKHLEELMVLPREAVAEIVLHGSVKLQDALKHMNDIIEKKETGVDNKLQINTCSLTVIDDVNCDIDQINESLKLINFKTHLQTTDAPHTANVGEF